MFLTLWMSCYAEPPPKADVLVLAGGGIVVLEDTIQQVDTNPHLVLGRIGPDTQVVEGGRATAGFVDAHAHPVSLGRTLEELDVTGLKTYTATLAKIREASSQGSGWLLGRGWDQNDWADAPTGGWPTADDLDRVTGDRPTMLRRIDGHAAWLNTAALTASDIEAATGAVEGGEILRGRGGRPSGILVDAAMELASPPSPADEQLSRWAVAGLSEMARMGLTGVHAMGMDDATLAALHALASEGQLPIRVWAYVSPDTRAAAQLALTGPHSEGLLEVVGVKLYADGALGSRGALLSEDYHDRAGHRGLAVTDSSTLADQAVRVTATGGQVAIHAIGDLGVRNALDAIAKVRAAHPDHAEVRHRVEHAQVVHPDDVPRFAELNVVASMQPTHATSDMPWAEARLGPKRVAWAYPWRTLQDAGATLAFGSDAPVESPSAAAGMWAAVTRTDPSGAPEGGWTPTEVVTEAEAVKAFSWGAAWSVHADTRLGDLRETGTADITVWQVDPQDGGPRWRPLATIVAGQVVWTDPSSEER